LFEGDLKMELVQQVRHARSAGKEVRNHEMSIILGYSLVATLLLMVIVLAFGSSGVPSGDIASMTSMTFFP
jgi:hypothetical protein